jgi:Kef-type K+ transport system membrane component KefB
MRYSTLGSIVFISAAIVALLGAYLAHTILRIPPLAVREDALGIAACLIAFIGVGLFMQRRGK